MQPIRYSLVAVLLLWPASQALAAVLSWTNTSGGNWAVAANWSPNQVPGPADSVFINAPGTYAVTNSASAQVASLELGGGSGTQSIELTSGTFTISSHASIISGGRLRWTSGTLAGRVTIGNGGILLADGSQTKTLNAAVTNQGTFQLSGSAEMQVDGTSGGRIENEGLFEMTADRDVYGISGSPVFRNNGTVRKSAGSGTARIGVPTSYPVTFHNSGLVESLSGVLQLFGSGTLAGQVNTSPGARVDLYGGTLTQLAAGAPTVGGAGTARFIGGTLQLVDAIPNLLLVGGNVVLLPSFQNGGSITNLTLDGASLGGTNRVTGTLRWRDGTINGVMTVPSGGTLLLDGTQTKTLNAAVTNRGTIQLGGSGDLHVAGNSGGKIENEGLFEFAADRDVYGINGSPIVRNSGTVRKSAGSGQARLGVPTSYPITLHNSGLLESLSGVLQVFGSGTLAGQLNSASGARVDLYGGTLTQVAPGAPVVGGLGSSRFIAGTLQLHDSISNLVLFGGSVVLLPDFQNAGSITNLALDGATLVGTNTVSGTLRWRDGTINGQLTVASSGTMIIEGTQTKTLNAGTTNRGTIQFTGSGDVHVAGNSGGRIENEGLFDFQGDRDLYGINGSPVFRNSGTLRKSAGGGTARVGVPTSYPVSFHNSGLVQSSTGVLQIFGSGTLAGQFSTSAGARVDLYGGTFTQMTAGVPTISGGGSTRFIAGTLQLHDSIANLTLVGGSVQLLPDFQNGGSITNLTLEGITLSGTNTVTGVLRWRDGTINGQLTIAGGGTLIIEGTQTKTLNGALTNQGTIQFTGSGDLHVAGNSGARIENEALFEFAGDRDLYGINGAPLFRNTGTIRKSAGTGTARLGVPTSYPVTFHNAGLIESLTGVLQIFGSGTLAGQLNTAAGARIDFNGGTLTQAAAGAPTVSGAGSSRFIAGTLQLHDSIASLLLVGGSLQLLPDFQNSGAITNLSLDGIALGGTNRVSGTLRWRDGSINGQLSIEIGGTLVVEGAQTKTLNAATTNRGTIQFTGSGDLHVSGNSGARIENEGLFDITADRDLYGINGSPLFRNTGTLRKSGGTGAGRLGVPTAYPVTFHNTGLIEGLSGVLQIFGSGTLGGQVNTAAGARVDFYGGTFAQTAAGAPVVSGAGSTRLIAGTLQLHDSIPNLLLAGGAVQLLPDFQNGGAITNLILEGATLSGTNTVTGVLRWRDGTINGLLTVASTGTLIVEGSATKTLNAAVTNRGTIQFGGTGELHAAGNSGARIENEGLFDFVADRDLYGINGSPLFRNVGTLLKSSGSGTARVGVATAYPIALQNLGTIEAIAGTLSVYGSTSLSNGSLRAAIRGAADFGRIHFGSAVALTGTLGAYLVPPYSPAISNKFAVVTFSSASGAFNNLDMPPGYFWQVEYTPAAANILPVAGSTQPPQISLQPQSRTNTPGTTATFMVGASGSAPLGFHWRFNGAPLTGGNGVSGVNSNRLTISNVHLDHAGAYSVMVSNAAGISNSATAQLVVDYTPPSLLPPTSQVIAGQTRAFTVSNGYPLFAFTLVANNSGASIGPASGVYTAGSTTGVTDTVRVTDAFGFTANAAVTVIGDPTPRPDLAVHSLSAPANIIPGVAFNVAWVLTNRGNATATAPWNDFILLSSDATLGSDLQLGSRPHTNHLPVNNSVTVTQQVIIPVEGPAGDFRLIIATDANLALQELVETNNAAVSTNTLLIPQQLTLSLPVVELREDAPNPVITTTLRRNGSTANALSANILSSAPGELLAPAVVQIPAGQSKVDFSLQVQADGVFDGPQSVTISAAAPGFAMGTAHFVVLDAQIPPLQLQLSSGSVTEGASVVAMLSRPSVVSSSPLTVNLVVSKPTQLFAPSTVNLPAGSNTVTFDVVALNDSKIELPDSITIFANAAGYSPANAPLSLTDNDLPSLSFGLSAGAVSEAAGANGVSGTITRDPVAPEALTVYLFSADTNIARVPASAVIPAGQPSVSFPVTVINNNVADGPRPVVFGASVRETSTGLVVSELTPVVLEVTDDEGPALALTLNAEVVGEGLNPATSATVTRNTPAADALLVTISSSNTNEASAQPSVTIPAGQTSMTFPIRSFSDGTNDGSKQVQFTVNAAGHGPGNATLVVSDADLPDLVVVSVQFQTNRLTGETNEILFRIENRGAAPATGGFGQRVFLSSDAVFGDDTLMLQNTFPGTLGSGQFFEQSFRVKMPNTVGKYWVIVQTDYAGGVTELLEGNNTFIAPTPVTVDAAFAVTVDADVTVALAGTPVNMTGHATRGNGVNAAFEPVSIHLELRGTRRIFQEITDAGGNYSLTFQPLPGEGGHYRVGAAHPGVTDPGFQDEFTLLALKAATPGQVRVLEGESASGMVAVQNLADVELTGLTATVIAGPTNVTIEPGLAVSIVPGDGTFMVSYTVAAPNGVSGSGAFRVRVDSAQGAFTEFLVPLFIEAKRARLVAYPGTLNTGMKRGGQRVVEFAVTNVGGLTTGPMQLLTPALPWLSAASGTQLPPLAPGEGLSISLLLNPATNLALGPYTGNLAINASNAVLSVPYTFVCLSDATGTMHIVSVDEYTYYAEGAPKVSNATVRVTDAITGNVINTNTGPTGELFLPGLVESFYYVDVSAEEHSSFRDLVQLRPGETNSVIGLMSRQSVRYTWTVVPIQIEDRYTITVETTFETAVPMPVVTIEPSVIDLANFVGTEQQINLTLRNHGLIAAQNTKLSFPTHSLWTFTPLISDIGALPPSSTLTIPLTIRRIDTNSPALASRAKSTGDACSLPAKVEWETPCGDTSIKNSISLGLISLIPACGGISTSGDPEGGGQEFLGGLGGGGGGGGTTELRSQEDGAPIFHDVPYKCEPCEQARFNHVIFHCFPKLIPGESWYSLGSELVGASSGAAARAVSKAAASGALSQCLKDLAKDFNPINPDCYAAYKSATNGSVGGAIGNGIKCTDLPKCTPGGGGGALTWAIECELELMELEECKGRGPGGFGSGPGGSGGTGGDAGPKSSQLLKFIEPDGSYSFVDPVIPPFDSAAPLLLSALRVHKLYRPWEYFLGDPAWRDATNDFAVNEMWESAIQTAVNSNSPAGLSIDDNEKAALLGGPLPVPLAVATRFVERINRTLDYASRGITNIAQVPAGESKYFIAMDVYTRLIEEAIAARAAIEAEGFINPVHSFISANVEYLNKQMQSSEGAVCARVKVRLDQEAVLTRDAFNARLEIVNETTGPLEEVAIEIRVRDSVRGETTSYFQVRPPELTGINAVDGTGVLPPQSTGLASFVLVPGSEAAPTESVQHFVSGTLRYRQNGVLVALPLAPAPITVLPNPKLIVKYFHERDVFSDDPFTPEIEPAIPYSLAVLIRNEGYGVARQMRITSAQPRIVDNEKDLLIDFEIIGSEVSGQPGTPSLTVNFGDIAPFATASARWFFRSSLQGLFTDYTATFEHLDGLGDKRFSLIDSVEIHEMNHVVYADRGLDDGKADFLVNDMPDFDDMPDTLHLSSGDTLPVAVFTQGTPSGAVSAYQLVISLQTVSANGWTYFRIPDPANGQFRLVQVRRQDGTTVPAENFWVTDRTFIGLGNRPRREFRLHLLDFQPAGNYTLTFENPVSPSDAMPPATQVNPLPVQAPLNFPITWNGSDVGSGIAGYDLFVSVNGGPFIKHLDNTPLNGMVFQGTFGSTYSFYTVGIDAAGNREATPAAPDAQTTVGISNRPPILTLAANATVDEGATLHLTPAVADPDLPAQELTFSLLSAPAGVSINPVNGALAWTTGEGHGPSTNSVVVRVLDNGTPALATTATVSVVVRELNQAPVLDPIAGATIVNGFLLIVPVAARDNDLPANQLTFALNPGAPAGANVNPATGTFTWRPTDAQARTTNQFSITVTDNGSPVRTATRSFTVVVRSRHTDFAFAVGSTNVFHGESNAVPLRLSTEIELSELTLTLNREGGALEGFALGSLAPQIGSALLEPLGPATSRLHLQFSGLDTANELQLGQLRFSAPSNLPSSVVILRPSDASALNYAGTLLTRAQLLDGRVLVVNREPILHLHQNEGPVVTVFGRPGATYELQYDSSLDGTPDWLPLGSVTLTDRFAAYELIGLGQNAILRAREVSPAPAAVQYDLGADEF